MNQTREKGVWGWRRHCWCCLENDELWPRYSAAGRTRVVAQFNLLRQTEQLENVFAQMLEGR
jgi:hypothetical protein